MKKRCNNLTLENSMIKLKDIIRENMFYDVSVSVLIKALNPKEAIGEPGRRDFPIIEGKERVIEAEFMGVKAHAFTDSPGEFVGKLSEILDLPLKSNRERAIYIATLNAVLKYLNIIEKTMHCRDEDPERCAQEIASQLFDRWGKVKVGLIGLNPAIAEMLTKTFGEGNVKITDLNKQNINALKYGVEIWDGNNMTEDLIKQSDVILFTGTTLVNGTFDYIINCSHNYRKAYLIYGVTGAGICKLMRLNRICPYGRN